MEKKNTRWLVGLLAVVMLVVAYAVPSVQADPHPGQSQYVAIIGSPTIINGGSLTTSGTDYAAFSFYNVSRTNLSLASLTNGTVCGGHACDTFVLNVASSYSLGGLNCTTSNLTAAQKADLNAFVANGGKMIIYDSECTFGGSVDYSWLDYPFNTTNPGATGSMTGSLVIAEDNILSHSDSTNVHYINTTAIVTQTDAVGDMNVVNLSTVDANWCLDLTGVNVYQTPGATHMYAQSGSGLLIYNGLDLDYDQYSSVGAQNLRKLWLQELQAVMDPSLLPCLVQVIGISLNPATATNYVGEEHTVTATVADLTGVGTPGVEVFFEVLSGSINEGATGTCSANADCTTDASGNVSFTYTGSLVAGLDEIQACFYNTQGVYTCSRIVEKQWIERIQDFCDVDDDNDIDLNDIRAILSARGTVVTTADVRDADEDGVITALDAKICIAQCTNPRCVSSN